MRNNQITGEQGETLASSYLQKQGYKIIERNFQKKHGDVDIVAMDGNTLAFIEVKTRKTRKFGLPIEAITPWKVRGLIQSAHLYKLLHPNLPRDIRIDIVSIDYSSNSTNPRIELIKNITL